MKKRYKILMALALSLTMMFGMSATAYAQFIYIEDTPVGFTYKYTRSGCSTLTAGAHSRDVVGYAYANYDDFTIIIKAEPLEESQYGFQHGVNGYASSSISYGTNSAIVPILLDHDEYYERLCDGPAFEVIENELYKEPAAKKKTPVLKDEESSVTDEQPNEQPGEQPTEELQTPIEKIIAAEEALPVTEFTSESEVNSMPATAKNSGATANLSKLTTMQGFSSAVTKLAAAAKANAISRNGVASVTVYTDRPMPFSNDMLEAIYAADVDFSYIFKYNGALYKIAIPKGAKVDFGGNKCEGPLCVGKILKTTQVIGEY